MKSIRIWAVVFFFTLETLCAEERQSRAAIPTSDIDAGVSAMVAGCVNAITGDFIHVSQDLLIVGPEPLLFERFYVSSDHEACSFLNSWRHNHHSEVFYSSPPPENHESSWGDSWFTADLLEPSGRRGIYATKNKGGRDLHVPLDWKSCSKGLTNSGMGILSGRTNPKNTRLTFLNKDNIIVARDGAGTNYHYRRQNKGHRDLNLSLIEKHTGNRLHYSYGIYDKEARVEKIQLAGRNGQVYSWIKIGNQPVKGLKKQGYFEISSSDGRKVRYKIAEARYETDPDNDDPSKQMRVHIEQVESSHAPTESYEYANRVKRHSELLSRKSLPDNRFLAIEYFTKEELKKHDFRLDRVKCLKAPVGADATPHTTHRFAYFAQQRTQPNANDEDERTVLHGQTHVFNIHNNKTVYGYDANHRLDVIERYTGNGNHKHYTSELFAWGADSSPDAGNLLSKRLVSGEQVLKGQAFTYDKYGNVEREILYGNLTGKGLPLTWQGGYPKENGADRYVKSYRHSDDKLNLLLESREDNGLGGLYGYHPNSDLLAYQFTTFNGAIAIRHFYEYDENGVVSKVTVDNGTSRDVNDLTQVTERHITVLQNRKSAPFGVPELVEERYLDLQTKQEQLLQRTRNSYSPTGELLSREVYDSAGELQYAQSWSYDAHGNVIAETNPLGHLIERTYDANDNMLTEMGPGPLLKTFAYDFCDRLIRIEEQDLTDNTILVTTHRYNGVHNRTATVDPYGQETQYSYDEFGRCTAISNPAIPTLTGQLVRAQSQNRYDPLDNVSVVIDPCGKETCYTHTILGKPSTIQYPDGTQESFQYNVDGTLQRATAKNGMTTTYTYDCLGRILSKEERAADGSFLSRTSATYNALHLTSSTDAMGRITLCTYDGAGRLIETRCDHQRTTYSYDTVGRIHTQCEWYSEQGYRKTVRNYDVLNRVIKEELFDNEQPTPLRTAAYTYDVDGNLIYEQHGNALTRMNYNGRKQLIYKLDPECAMTLIRYNPKARDRYGVTVLETTITDPLGNQTITLSNALGKVGSIIRKNEMGQNTAQRDHYYNGAGDLQDAIDTVISPVEPSKQILTHWNYNATHQVIELIEAVGTPDQQSVRMRYNSAGQRETLIKHDGTEVRHTYDGKGRLQTITAPGVDYHYTYDAADHPICITDRLNQTKTTRQYAEGQLIAEELANGHTLSYTYDCIDRPLTVTFPDQSGVRYSYGAVDLKQVERLTNGKTLYTHLYSTYDPLGRPLEQQLLGNAGILQFDYDRTGRPIKTIHRHLLETATYDDVGNLKHRMLKCSKHVQNSDYTYDDLYQLKSESGQHTHTYLHDSLFNCIKKDDAARTFNNRHHLLSSGTEQYEYDRNGNLLLRKPEQTRYQYDALDRLTTIERGTSRALYTYDALHRRLSTRLQEQRNGKWIDLSTTHYIYQGQDEVGSIQNGKITSLRILGVGKGAEIGASIAIELNGKPYAPLHDHNGNLVGLLDQAGQLAESYRYSAFGEESIFDVNEKPIPQSALSNPWRFSSKRTDPESGLVYFGRRYYDPRLARWLTPDPLGFDAGPNLFAYVQNNPLTHIDLYGLEEDNKHTGRFRQRDYDSYNPKYSSPDTHANRGRDFVKAVRKGIEYIGTGIKFVSTHLVPIPNVQDVFGLLGSSLEGTLSSWRPSHQEAHSRLLGTVGYGQLAPNIEIAYVGGMLCSDADTMKQTSITSASFGGARVAALYNNSHGFVPDLLEAGLQTTIGVSMNSDRVVQKWLRETLKRLGKNGVIILISHSQGGAIVHNALCKLTGEQRGQIHSITFGSAKMIYPDSLGLKDGQNYVSRYDPVPFVADPVGCIKGIATKHRSFNMIEGRTLFRDHCFAEGRPYEVKMNEVARDLNRLYKER